MVSTIFCDGGSLNNQKSSRKAYASFKLDNNIIRIPSLGSMTNNEAEYSSLIEALKYSLKYNKKDIKIHMDSALVVNQVKGNWKVKASHLNKYKLQVLELLTNFNSWELIWIDNLKMKQILGH